jgi:DNA-binding GntR family transcriptional regulator
VYARIRPYAVLLARNGYITNVRGVIDRGSPVAPWRQIAEIYRGRIRSGDLKSGDRIPSIATLAQEYQVAATTAQKAVEALRDEGLVATSPMGTFVI